MKETSKATARRMEEEYPWDDVFHGKVLDVGAGDDPLQWMKAEVTAFDKPQGDANKIDTYFPPESFQCVHGSQVMEHLYDPEDFLRRCLKLVPIGGYVVMTVPSELYEGNILPSRYNGDHKCTFSAITIKAQHQTSAPRKYKHFFLPMWKDKFAPHELWVRLIDDNYDYVVGTTRDQSFNFDDMVECWWEIVLKKMI